MIISAIENDEFFGLIEIDVFAPSEVIEQCKKVNFAPIFNKIPVTREMLSSKMRKRADIYKFKLPTRDQLTLVYEANDYLCTTDMLKFFLQLGMIVTDIKYCIEYQKCKPLEKFVNLGWNRIILD